MDKINKSGIRKRAKELNFKGHELYEWCACEDCGKERWVVILKGDIASRRCKQCAQKHEAKTRVGINHHAWKGGKRTNNGYAWVYMPSNHRFESMRMGCKIPYILEHRLIMAEYLGRSLTKNELVHHKDGNRSNNDISNLELTHRGEHEKNHSEGYRDGFDKGYMDGFQKAMQEGIWKNQNQ